MILRTYLEPRDSFLGHPVVEGLPIQNAQLCKYMCTKLQPCHPTAALFPHGHVWLSLSGDWSTCANVQNMHQSGRGISSAVQPGPTFPINHLKTRWRIRGRPGGAGAHREIDGDFTALPQAVGANRPYRIGDWGKAEWDWTMTCGNWRHYKQKPHIFDVWNYFWSLLNDPCFLIHRIA